MFSSRILIVFFVSIIVFALFTLLVAYNLFYKDVGLSVGDLYYQKVKSQIDNIYTTLKYDLQNVVRDNEYKPISDVFVYGKNNKSFSFIKGDGHTKESVFGYIGKNIQDIVFLDDGFGYILPIYKESKLYLFLALERGDNIYIAALSNKNDYKNIDICVVFANKLGRTFQCEGNEYREIAKFKFFSLKFRYKEPLNYKLLILAIVLFIIIGGFFSFWATRHLDIEEKRLLNEIKGSIEDVKEGKIHLLTYKSVYLSYNQLVESINSLIQLMSAEIDKHRVVYDEYFKRQEKGESINESSDSILKIFFEDFSEEKYLKLLRSFDLLLQQNGGGLKFKGKIINEQIVLVKLLTIVLLEIHSVARGYQLIVESSESGISINSENFDFELDRSNSVLFSFQNIQYSNRKITIVPY